MVRKLTPLLFLFSLFFSASMHARIVFSSIDTPGFYQLSDNLTNSVTITVSNVTFDLNGHTINATNGIVINAGLDEICIKNGVIEATADGIIAGSGCTHITLEDLKVKNAIRGINFENVTGGMIKSCEMTSNTTGVELDNSHKIIVKDSVASCNTHAGFDLLSSTTCLFENCKALSTGEGNNNEFDNNVFGFVSADGYGNIFERCIASSTQAITTSDSNSLIAGFALRGSEKCSKIVDSEAANSVSDVAGFTVPHGILLEGSLGSVQSVTGAFPNAGLSEVLALDWSPDGKYVAIGGDDLTENSGDELQIFRFDRISGGLTLIAGALPAAANNQINSVHWSPDGTYIAVGGTSLAGGTGDEFQIFKFDRDTGTLTSLAGALGANGQVLSVHWSPDGQYLAVGGVDLTGGTGDELQIFRFDRASEALHSVAGVLPNGANGQVLSVHWSPDGEYIAVGGTTLASGTGDNVQIFLFDRALAQLISVAGAFPQGSNPPAFSVSWSPNGKYVACGFFGGSIDKFQLLQFDRDAGDLSVVSSVAVGILVSEVHWSADGKYIAVGGSALMDGELQLFRFDGSSGALILVTAAFPAAPNNRVNGAKWSPDGQYIAVGGDGIVDGTGDELQILTGIQFPLKNIIKNNTVYCNSGGVCPSGVGISGSSIQNLIIGNTSYSNPIPRGANAPIVSSNYQFVTNIFNQLFGQAPSAVQNISLDGCEPVCTPEDVALLVKQALYKVCTPIPSQLDMIESKLDALDLSISSSLSPCAPTAINAATTISSSGNYCLVQDITGPISIEADDVVLDLNGRMVSGGTSGVTIGASSPASRVTVKNGSLSNNTIIGAFVGAGCRDITLEDITAVDNGDFGINVSAGNTERVFIKGCNVRGSNQGLDLEKASNVYISDCTFSECIGKAGMRIENVDKAIIKNCDMVLNATGIEVVLSHEIVIDSCNALSNYSVGFELDQTFTSCLRDCKAVNTGLTNDLVFNNNVYGFLARNGQDNIFERCIANATQALSTTGSNSIVAGFALRERESHTKIIDCEAANTTTNPNGFTVPYGIILQSAFDEGFTETSNPPVPDPIGTGNSVDWSPDGKYFVSGHNSDETTRINVYRFDRVSYVSSRVATPDIAFAGGVNILSVDWSPDTITIAAGANSTDASRVRIFEFDPTQLTLKQVAVPTGSDIPGDNVNSVAWSADGNYLAAGISETSDANRIRIYKYNRVERTLTQVAVPTGSDIPGDRVNSVMWSPDGEYLAAGIDQADSTPVRIYRFEKATNGLTQVASVSLSERSPEIRWSPDGNYLAMASGEVAVDPEFRIYRFDRVDFSLDQVVVSNRDLAFAVESIDWSPDGRYFALSTATSALRVYSFDRAIDFVQELISVSSIGGNAQELRWSPDGAFVVFAGGFPGEIQLREVLTFPEKNVITGNTVYCNSGAEFPGGVGISGSSIANMITGNTAYSNPIPQSANKPIVSSNYEFVTNIFSQLFGDAPSAVQNISLDGCEPICAQENIPLLIKQVFAKVDGLGACAPTALTEADIVSGDINLTEAGNYCLAEDLTADINITGTCISLDLNDRCLTGVIDVSTSDDVIVQNGTVKPAAPANSGEASTAAITLNTTANRIQIVDVVIECAATQAATVDGGVGRTGIEVLANQVQIINCTITPGIGADGNATSAGDGGDGISIGADAHEIVVKKCTIKGADGGDTSETAASGGDGGAGITIGDAGSIEIFDNEILSTGIGGDGDGIGGQNGSGGHGIAVASTAINVGIHNNVIRNTGPDGSGSGGAGSNGRAINDEVAAGTGETVSYSNVAYNIADTTIRYNLNAAGAESGSSITHPPNSTAISAFTNVYFT